MADIDPQLKRLLLPAEETLFEQLLRFGLYIGAIFQVMCLLAIVVYQAGPSDGIAALKVLRRAIIVILNNSGVEEAMLTDCRTTPATWNALKTARRSLRGDPIERENRRRRKDDERLFYVHGKAMT